MKMDCDIRKLDSQTSHFLPHIHQPFDVIGYFVPMYDGKKWFYKEMLCTGNRQKKYEDDSIVPEDYIENKERAMFLAIRHDSCIGSIRISTDWFGDGHIDDLAVDAQYRHSGIGKSLMDSAVAWCRERQYSRVTLETQDNNLQACRFYIKYGFALCGINTQKYALLPKYKGETALYFYMEL